MGYDQWTALAVLTFRYCRDRDGPNSIVANNRQCYPYCGGGINDYGPRAPRSRWTTARFQETARCGGAIVYLRRHGRSLNSTFSGNRGNWAAP